MLEMLSYGGGIEISSIWSMSHSLREIFRNMETGSDVGVSYTVIQCIKQMVPSRVLLYGY